MTMTQTSGPVAERAHGLAQTYAPHSPATDEMTEADGSLRAHWRPFVSMMDDLGNAEVLRRREQCQRLIRENGITHNVYSDPEGTARPWSLDLVPLLIPHAEWKDVGASLAQRARLLNAILADLYGPATSLTSGVLPPEVIYANPGFLRAAHGIKPRRGEWVHLYAADLIRCPDGQFRVLCDRTQGPSGAGYSLESRIVLTQTLATVFQQCNAMRLAPFFIALRRTLLALAPENRENPRVVLLTPGPFNETYFEHAYLARYLGYTLVQGNDLTVRDSRVFLKTLGGLQRVDVILRRVDDDFCDPLELYAHSFLGVPGLLQAVREGNVAVANAIGSGVLQSPAILPFLPGLCRHLLGEELAMPSVRTWWCGEPQSLRYVLQNLGKLVVKSAFAAVSDDPVFGPGLSTAEREALARKIQARPIYYVGQELIDSYTTPVLVDGEAQPRRFLVRAYLTAEEGSYAVMPGALTRVAASADSRVVSLQKGVAAKDTWILGTEPTSVVTLLTPASEPVELSRGGGDLPSRVADDLFWLGRYVQCAESTVRLARTVFNRLADPNVIESPSAIEAMMRELVGRKAPKFAPGAARQLASELFGPGDPSWLRSSMKHLHNLSRVLRDRISSDAWRILSSIERRIAEFDGAIDDDQVSTVLEVVNELVFAFLAFSGMAMDSMSRGQRWRFLDMGVRLERGIVMARLIRATLVAVTPQESFILDALLEAADSSITYRSRYLNRLDAAAVVDLLLADESNPRAVAFQIATLERHLESLPREASHPLRHPDNQLVVRLRSMIRLADLNAVCKPTKARREALAELTTSCIEQLTMISELVAQIFFNHAMVSPRFLSAELERPA